MATIQDVVRLSGVSVATVSRVLHDSPNVLPATREKVLAAIRELDYRPNRLAQQFRTQRTMIVLVLTGKKSRAPKAEGIPYDKGMR